MSRTQLLLDRVAGYGYCVCDPADLLTWRVTMPCWIFTRTTDPAAFDATAEYYCDSFVTQPRTLLDTLFELDRGAYTDTYKRTGNWVAAATKVGRLAQPGEWLAPAEFTFPVWYRPYPLDKPGGLVDDPTLNIAIDIRTTPRLCGIVYRNRQYTLYVLDVDGVSELPFKAGAGITTSNHRSLYAAAIKRLGEMWKASNQCKNYTEDGKVFDQTTYTLFQFDSFRHLLVPILDSTRVRW